MRSAWFKDLLVTFADIANYKSVYTEPSELTETEDEFWLYCNGGWDNMTGDMQNDGEGEIYFIGPLSEKTAEIEFEWAKGEAKRLLDSNPGDRQVIKDSPIFFKVWNNQPEEEKTFGAFEIHIFSAAEIEDVLAMGVKMSLAEWRANKNSIIHHLWDPRPRAVKIARLLGNSR